MEKRAMGREFNRQLQKVHRRDAESAEKKKTDATTKRRHGGALEDLDYREGTTTRRKCEGDKPQMDCSTVAITSSRHPQRLR
jgi:hypothetical protein